MTSDDFAVQLKWMAEPKDTEIGAGKPVHIACLAEGSPEPTIQWSKDGIPVGSELRFVSVSQQDAGLYECRARNGADEDLVARIRLSVLGK